MNYLEYTVYKNTVCKQKAFEECENCGKQWTDIEKCEYEAFRRQ